MFSNRRSFTQLLPLVALLIWSFPASGQRNFTEDFSSENYKDVTNTTAVWDTSEGKLRLPVFTPSIIGAGADANDAWDLEIDGDLAFVADGLSGLRIFDISDPGGPVQVGIFDTPVSVHDLKVDGDRVYLADGPAGMPILDISDPTTPTILGVYNSPGAVRDVEIYGNHALVADDTGGMRVVDVSNPALPVEVGSFNPPGVARDLAIRGKHVLVANGFRSLWVVDITDPSSPFDVGFVPTVDNAVDVEISGDYAYVADGAAGVTVIDIAFPSFPNRVWTEPTGDYCRGVAVVGDHLYAADGAAGLKIYDISVPDRPMLLNAVDTPGAAYGVDVDGALAFVADVASGLQVIRIAHRSGPPYAGGAALPAISEGMAVDGDLLVVAAGTAGVGLFDITDPRSPIELGFVDPPGNARDVVARDGFAYVANGFQDFRIFEIWNTPVPAETGSVSTGDAAQGVDLRGSHAYVADGFQGLKVINVSDPWNPTIVGSQNTPGYAQDVTVDGKYAFIADGSGGLRIADISTPTAPTLIGHLETPGDARAIAVAGNLAFLADGDEGWRIIDISDPALPVEIFSRNNNPAVAEDIAVAGNYVYVAGFSLNLNVWDITDPTNPLGATSIGIGGTGHSLALAGDHAFLSTDEPALQVREIFQRRRERTLNVGQSIDVNVLDEEVLKLRLTANVVPSVGWYFSLDGGGSWENLSPTGSWWTPLAPTSTDLRWRANLIHTGIDVSVWDMKLEWLIDAPVVNSVVDIPNDQGRQVRVEWARSGHDFQGDANQITEYAVYRQIDPALKHSAAANAVAGAEAQLPTMDANRVAHGNGDLTRSVQEHASMMAQAGWDFLTFVPVRLDDYYAVVVPTLADSTIAAGEYLSTFMVTALTATPGEYFDSAPLSGYSVDNLAPGVPQNIVAGYTQAGAHLNWDDAQEEDLQLFRIYRSSSPDFSPSTEFLVQEVASSQWLDATSNPWGLYYKISAVDHAGNESPAGAPGFVTGAPVESLSPRSALYEPTPNPFNPSTLLRFTVPGTGMRHTRLEVYDGAGRLVVRLLDGVRAPGEHAIRWIGTDASGRRVGSGVYFALLQVEGEPARTQKMTLVK